MQTSPEDFESFKRHFFEWQTKLSCLDYEAFFRHEEISGADADIWSDNSGRHCTVRLATEVSDGETMEALAKHEAIHLFLKKLSRFTIGDDRVSEEEEGMVRILEKLL